MHPGHPCVLRTLVCATCVVTSTFAVEIEEPIVCEVGFDYAEIISADELFGTNSFADSPVIPISPSTKSGSLAANIVELHVDVHGEQFLELCRDGELRYVPLPDRPEDISLAIPSFTLGGSLNLNPVSTASTALAVPEPSSCVAFLSLLLSLLLLRNRRVC